ncbi:MAG TPA: thrombospondin type 3 repeat-containing protein, partial [Saprospiraceae bacterium]|nr:thrombospondin type 3 repeat-containing protein [Saprospiraceae bacterium]
GFNTLTQANNINITADDITGFATLPQATRLTLTGDLNNFDAFALLTTISESLTLQTQRSDYNIFPALQNVESLVISNSPNFTGNGFPPIAQIKNLDIRNCSSLVNLSGLLPRPKYGSVVLINNSSMTNLAGLETVKNLVNLSISGNSSLTDIQALDSMRIIQGNLSLVNNTSLNECCVLAFIINRNKVFGFIDISGNAHDCEDIVMVLEETCLDSDGDGIADPQDNCPLANNSDQSDIDTDGVGDMCDNCIDIANSGQEDDNGDGIGNVCQPTAGTGFMDLNDADLYITNNQRGVILKTRSGNCYRIRIDESGKVLSIPLLQCP